MYVNGDLDLFILNPHGGLINIDHQRFLELQQTTTEKKQGRSCGEILDF